MFSQNMNIHRWFEMCTLRYTDQNLILTSETVYEHRENKLFLINMSRQLCYICSLIHTIKLRGDENRIMYNAVST